jgi:hypothetical protein
MRYLCSNKESVHVNDNYKKYEKDNRYYRKINFILLACQYQPCLSCFSVTISNE